MTVSSTTDRETFPGNGVATGFPLSFRFFANSDVQVGLVDDVTFEITPQILGVNYSLVGAGLPEVDGNAASELTMFVAPPVGKSLFVKRVMPIVQPTDIVNQGRFFPETHETVFDRLTMLIQQAALAPSRTIRVPEIDPVPGVLPSVPGRAGKAFGFDSNGDPIVSTMDLSTIEGQVSISSEYAQDAEASAQLAADIYDSFDDRYLGPKSADPVTDNDGDPLLVGAIYWNTVSSKMKAWSGTVWYFWAGDIVGPLSSSDNALPVFNGTTGKALKQSSAKVDSSGNVLSNGIQVGQSATASQNFHWRNLLDGLLRLTRGNAGTPITDVMRVKADNSVEFPGGIAEKNQCTAWVNFNGVGTVSIRDSYNVSSITDNGVGTYTVNFATPMVNANYAVAAAAGPTTGSAPYQMCVGASGLGTNVDPTINGFTSYHYRANQDDDFGRVMFSVFGGK